MKKVIKKISVASVILLLFLQYACDWNWLFPPGKGGLKINMTYDESIDPVSFDICMDGPGKNSWEKTGYEENSIVIEDLIEGKWDIIIDAKDNEQVVARGEKTVQVIYDRQEEIGIHLETSPPTLEPPPTPTPCTQIFVTAGENGSINPSGTETVFPGEDATFTIQADPNYAIETIMVDNEPVEEEAEGSYSYNFTIPDVTDCQTIDVTFRIAKLTFQHVVNDQLETEIVDFYPNYAIATQEQNRDDVDFCNWRVKKGDADIVANNYWTTTISEIRGDTEIYPEYGTCRCILDTDPDHDINNITSLGIIVGDILDYTENSQCIQGTGDYDVGNWREKGEKWLMITVVESPLQSDVRLWVKLICPDYIDYDLYLYDNSPGHPLLVNESSSAGYGGVEVVSDTFLDIPNVFDSKEYYIEIRYVADNAQTEVQSCESWSLFVWGGCENVPGTTTEPTPLPTETPEPTFWLPPLPTVTPVPTDTPTLAPTDEPTIAPTDMPTPTPTDTPAPDPTPEETQACYTLSVAGLIYNCGVNYYRVTVSPGKSCYDPGESVTVTAPSSYSCDDGTGHGFSCNTLVWKDNSTGAVLATGTTYSFVINKNTSLEVCYSCTSTSYSAYTECH